MVLKGKVFRDVCRPYRTERLVKYKEDDGRNSMAFASDFRITFEASGLRRKATENKLDNLMNEMTERAKKIIAGD